MMVESYIRQFSLHEHLNPELLRCLRLFQFEAGYELFLQAQPQTFFYFLVAGKVQVIHDHPNGKFSVLAIMTPLAVIGDLELFSDAEVKTNVVTLEKTTLLGIEKTFVRKYGGDDPRFLKFVIQHLTAKLYQSSLVQAGNALPLMQRLAGFLLRAEYETLPSKTNLAALLGTTVRHLNRVLKLLEEEQVIRLQKRRLKILNRDRLESLSQS